MQRASDIVFPQVPDAEQDPRGRINTMIKIFNENLPHVVRARGDPNRQGEINKGLLFEIVTAMKLVRERKVTHGKEISRGLTLEETTKNINGASQMIRVPLDVPNTFRELDIVYNGTNIVEIKNKKTTDTSQMKANLLLAQSLRGTLTYAVPHGLSREFLEKESAGKLTFRDMIENVEDNPTKKGSYLAAYERLAKDLQEPVPQLIFEAVTVPDFSNGYNAGRFLDLSKMTTFAEALERMEEEGP